MISAGHSLAAAAGYRILEDGGNAIDAGVASGIVINTVLPENTSFGGVAPIMIYDAASDEVVTISGLGRWPRKASAEFFIEQAGGRDPGRHPAQHRSGRPRCVADRTRAVRDDEL